MEYTLRDMENGEAIQILKAIVENLSTVEEGDLTTIELNILHMCTMNPPKRYIGCELAILQHNTP